MTTIPLSEVRFHPHSFADRGGRLFWWKGDLYRGLSGGTGEFFAQLLRDGTLERLSEQGLLVDTQGTDFSLDGFEAVVRHRILPFVSYPEEWCPAMLQDAALALLDLLIELGRSCLTLKDAHPWNLLFDRGKPFYFDLTSIVPLKDDQWRGYDEFRRFYLNPLLLMAHNQERIARRLLLEYDGVLDADVAALCRSDSLSSLLPALVRRAKKTWRRAQQRTWAPQSQRSFHTEKPPAARSIIAYGEIKREIEDIDLPGASLMGGTEAVVQSVQARDKWTPIQRRACETLAQLKPASVLDVGTTAYGWYSFAAVASGLAALSMSTDSTLLTQLYLKTRRERWSLLPVVMDFTDPTPSRGLCSHWSIAASDRLKCDLVLALGNVDQWIFQRSLNFTQIIDGFASFSKRWLLAEFVPPSDDSLRKFSRKISWYNFEHFVEALKERFPSVTVLPSSPAGRMLLVCEK
jgi:hypothetical protein